MAIAARPVLTIEMIYAKISSLQLFHKYCSGFTKADKLFNSELRSDPDASCSIGFFNGDYLYHDFGTNESYRAVNYIMVKYSINYYDALQKIQQELNLELDPITSMHCSVSSPGDKSVTTSTKPPSVIQRKARPFNKDDKSYWYDRYAIHRSTLEHFAVIPISEFWIDSVNYLAAKQAYSYDFYWENNIFRRKLYQPLLPKKEGKWYSNGGLVVQGEGMLPYSGDLLIITKSHKDVMELYELGYTAIAPVSESTWLPESYFEKQKTRFNRLVLLFDNDTSGKKRSTIFGEKYNIPSIEIPTGIVDCKDISDVVYHKGMDFASNLMKELL